MKELSSFLDYAVALTFQDQTKSFGGGWANTKKLSLLSCLQFEKPSCFERNEIVRLFTWYVWNSCIILKDIRSPTDATSPFPLSPPPVVFSPALKYYVHHLKEEEEGEGKLSPPEILAILAKLGKEEVVRPPIFRMRKVGVGGGNFLFL